MTITLSQEFYLEHCFCCGVAFAMPVALNQVLRDTHRYFYCPNGHSQFYPGKSEAEQLKAVLAQQQAEFKRIADQREAEFRRLAEEKARIEKRIGAGVCICCNRSFQDLRRHIKTKHATFGKALPAAAHAKKLLTQ